MISNVNVDLNPIVAAMLRVLVEPYKSFVEKLSAEGRIDALEVKALQIDILERGERLAELIQKDLDQGH
jgi:hypothetical protein